MEYWTKNTENVTQDYGSDDDNRAISAPRAVIHKRILDLAEERPDASMEAIAENVSGANVEIVEQVLEEYGDPGQDADPDEPSVADSTDQHPAESDDGNQSMNDNGPLDDAVPTAAREKLTDRQLETLKAIYRQPEATQAEIADHLDMSKSTINTRVNSIDGFEWETRKQFVTSLFDDYGEVPGDDLDPDRVTELTEELDEIASKIERIERRLDRQTSIGQSALDDPDLAHKVVHACLTSDMVSEEEELQLLREMTTNAEGSE